jgi:glycosyltransferase involved in cell wall biosynthesis
LSKFKVIYLVSTLQSSGPTNQLYNIINNLDRDQFEPYLITFSPEPVESRWTDYKRLGVQMQSINLSRLGGFFLAKLILKKLIATIQPDVIHTQGIRADRLSAGLSVNIPRICTVRNIPQQDYPMTYGNLVGAQMVRSHTRAMHRLERCVGVSKAVCENLRQSFGLLNVEIIRNGVDTQAYFPANESEKKVLRRKLALPKEGSLWITSGHLSERKDPLFLINMWKACFGGEPENQLLFVGSGPLEGDCKESVEGFKNIHFSGRVSNVADYLRAGDFFVSASKAEGLPNAVLEAMACGLPVLLSDIAPHREIFELSSNIGELYQLGSAEGFSQCLEKVKCSSWSAQSEAAQLLTLKTLSAQAMSKSYQVMYSKLAS